MSNNPFAAAIANAETREAAAAMLREEQKRWYAAQEQQAAAVKKFERQQAQLHDFGLRFLEVVVRKVVRPEWKSSYVKLIQQFSEALLMREDQTLPDINMKHREKILNIFAYGLRLAADHGVRVEDGFFYGQRLLAEQKVTKPGKPDRLVIRRGERPHAARLAYSTSSKVVELPRATTPRSKHGKGKYKPAKVG